VSAFEAAIIGGGGRCGLAGSRGLEHSHTKPHTRTQGYRYTCKEIVSGCVEVVTGACLEYIHVVRGVVNTGLVLWHFCMYSTIGTLCWTLAVRGARSAREGSQYEKESELYTSNYTSPLTLAICCPVAALSLHVAARSLL
jgi:hypothetical protein